MATTATTTAATAATTTATTTVTAASTTGTISTQPTPSVTPSTSTGSVTSTSGTPGTVTIIKTVSVPAATSTASTSNSTLFPWTSTSLIGGRKEKMWALLMPGKTGKSLLCGAMTEFSAVKAKFLFIDIDTLCSDILGVNWTSISDDATITSMVTFDQIRAQLASTWNTFATTNIVIVCSNPDLVKYLQIKPKRVFSLLPSTAMLTDLIKKITTDVSSNATTIESFIASHQSIIKASILHPGTTIKDAVLYVVHYFSDNSNLISIVKEIFGLVKKI
jgi:hypothetical protein